VAIRIPQKLALCYSRHQFSSPFKRDLLYYMMVFCTIIGSQVQSTKSKDVYSEEGFPTGLVRERCTTERHHKTFFRNLQKKGLQCPMQLSNKL
jgi:hypothetical protein